MKGGACKLEHLDLSACENITNVTLRSLAGDDLSAQGPRLDDEISCEGKGGHSVPSVIVNVSVSEHDYDYAPQENDSFIARDLSFTDLPLELCSLDCMDICVERAPTSGVEKPDSGGTDCGRTTDIFFYCCAKRTCCSSEDRDAKTGCCGGGGDEQKSCCEQKEVKKTSGEAPHALHRLTHLSLSGCFQISDDGLR